MNFVAHVLVCHRAGDPDPEAALGAALPDLARMAGLGYDPDRLPPAVRRGVACHHRADACFHADRTFLAGAGRLRATARAAGLPLGASRAVGHVGWELLLDGALVDPTATGMATDPAEITGYLVAAADAAGVVEPALAGAAGRWWDLVSSLRDERWWLRYADPGFVAERLYGVTRRRPRLAFPEDQVPALTEVLAAAQPAVAAATPTVVRSVVDRL